MATQQTEPVAHPFLSPAWIDEVRAIRDEYRHLAADIPTPSMSANLVVTEVPFDERKVLAHARVADGGVEIELGHLPDVDVTVTLEYALARRIVLEQEPEMIAKAWLLGKIRVDGDLTKLLPSGDPAVLVAAANEAAGDPLAAELSARIRAITQPH